MELELEPRVKFLSYKVRGVSRESQAQKAAHLLDTDLRSHWSTSTNTKEWLLLELEEPCLLSHIRVHNKSVLEWEISVGLRYKPDTFVKVRPRCEAPRRDIQYHIGYVPCRFVRISCLRGNPIAIFFIQLIGISIPGLEPEFQPIVDHLLPQIISHKQDPQDLYLQLLQDITMRLSPFLSHLEGDLSASGEAMESSIRFLAMLAGPFYPILMVLRGRENINSASRGIDQESVKNIQASVFTVSSNFQAPPRRSRSPVPSQQSAGHTLAFRPDVVLLLLKVAYKDNTLGTVCRMVARLLRKLAGPVSSVEALAVGSESATSFNSQNVSGTEDVGVTAEAPMPLSQTDFVPLFGEEFRVTDDDVELAGLMVVDVAAVEEGLLHFLYACASQPLLCRRLVDAKPDLSPALPFVQAMLRALRPRLSSSANTDQVDDSFTQWQIPMVQRAVTQVVAVSTSPAYRRLLDACSGYLSSYSPAHEKAACVLIDLCSGPLAPWLPMVIAKVDLAVELVEDLLGVIQGGHHATARARAALIYLMLGLSGHMDDVLSKYKAVKHNLIFLIEMLEPFLIPAITPVKNTIAFGDVSTILLEKQERTCALALDLIRTAIGKPAVLPALEAEWRRGHVAPSVLLSILAPHVPLPAGIDLRRSMAEKGTERESLIISQGALDANVTKLNSGTLKGATSEEDGTGKFEQVTDGISKVDANEEPGLLFAPVELHGMSLRNFSSPFEGTTSDSQSFGQFVAKVDSKPADSKDIPTWEALVFDANCAEQYFNLQAEYLQLVNFQERELRAAEFIRFATELHSRTDMSWESHHTAIDALLLAAECHLNPFFMIHSTDYQQLMNRITSSRHATTFTGNRNDLWDEAKGKGSKGVQLISHIEEERDKAVLHILLKAAEWDWEAVRNASEEIFLVQESLSNEFEDMPSCICISDNDAPTEDATTLVRKHQRLFCKFLVHQLQRERHNMYEVLLQGLLFLLYSATRLPPSPEDIVDVILKSVERLNKILVSLHNQIKEGNSVVGPTVVHSIRRQWALLGRLVVAASGGGSVEEDNDFHNEEVVYYRDLVSSSAWMAKIAQFSSSPFPLVRYMGWKALARFAKFQEKTGLFLASDMQQLTSLLSIFSDDLTSLSLLGHKNSSSDESPLQFATRSGFENSQGQLSGSDGDQSVNVDGGHLVSVLYPELDLVFPKMRGQFSQFANAMLDAVCLQLKSIPSNAVSDILSWFSELCYCPFTELEFERKQNLASSGPGVKGFELANARFIILHLLEVIVSEHMEAIVPELPRVLDIILSICRSSYCDVQLLESVLIAMKPIISYAVSLAAASEYELEDDPSAVTFEALCFDSLMDQLRVGPDSKEINAGQGSKGAMLLFFSGFLLSDLSVARLKELLNFLLRWTKFTDYGTPSSYYNYLRAFQKIIEGCDYLVQAVLEKGGFYLHERVGSVNQPPRDPITTINLLESFPLQKPSPHLNIEVFEDLEFQEIRSRTVDQYLQNAPRTKSFKPDANEVISNDEDQVATLEHTRPSIFQSQHELEEFSKNLLAIMSSLGSSLEAAWKLHPQLVEKVSSKAAHCLMMTNLLLSNYAKVAVLKLENDHVMVPIDSNMQGKWVPSIWKHALESVAQMVISFQHEHCWQVAAAMMEFLLSLPNCFGVSEVLSSICVALQYQSIHAPRVSWRLLANKWLSKVVARVVTDNMSLSPAPLVQLLNTMLEHSEPEQRTGALQQLEKLLDLEELCRKTPMMGPVEEHHSYEYWQAGEYFKEKLNDSGFVTGIVSTTWDTVASLVSCDPSLSIQRHAMELLLKFTPIAQQHQLHEFLSSVDVVLPLLTRSVYTMKDGPMTRLALAILARACLYSSPASTTAISPSVWSSLEILANSKPGSTFFEPERAVCVALLQLREHGEDAKKDVEEALSTQHGTPKLNPEFIDVRETVLEVLARLNAARLKEDGYRDAAMQEAKELEEAEIELELVKQERSLQDRAGLESVQTRAASSSLASSSGSSTTQVKHRLKELRSQILAEDHLATRAEVAARRERQRIARRDRQLALEEATLRELELLQELDRERVSESEREIERQRILERERAKSRELQHALELEAEKRTQRELQRELEQRDSGIVRSSRREFASSTQSSRPRERYRERERETGRSSQDSRPSSTGRENGATPPATPTAGAGNISNTTSSISAVVISSSSINSRAYPGQSLMFSNTRDPSDDRGYDEILDGGEGSSYVDMDSGTMIDSGSSSGLVGSHRQGPRGSRPRQIVERRERDARREGKWERKQT